MITHFIMVLLYFFIKLGHYERIARNHTIKNIPYDYTLMGKYKIRFMLVVELYFLIEKYLLKEGLKSVALSD